MGFWNLAGLGGGCEQGERGSKRKGVQLTMLGVTAVDLCHRSPHPKLFHSVTPWYLLPFDGQGGKV